MLLKYRELGLSVMPVKGKFPVMDWKRWQEDPAPMDLVARWEKIFPLPEYGIGIICGEISGIDALDVDANSRDILDLAPRSPVTRIGKKGRVSVFRHNPGLKKREAWRDSLCPELEREEIQLLSNGNYFVAPPSIHPETGKPYYWELNSLENFSLLDLEQISQNELDELAVYVSRFPRTNRDGTTGSMMGGGRNNKLTQMCYAKLLTNPNTEDEAVARELLDFDDRKHAPPYFSDPKEQYFFKGKTPLERAILFVSQSRKRIQGKNLI